MLLKHSNVRKCEIIQTIVFFGVFSVNINLGNKYLKTILITFLSGTSDESFINLYMHLNEYSEIVPKRSFSKNKMFN